MIALESWLYGDPEAVAIRREAAAHKAHARCGDCIHKRTEIVRREIVYRCVFSKRKYGIRCDLYKADQLHKQESLSK